jgi:hypothetical protein
MAHTILGAALFLAFACLVFLSTRDIIRQLRRLKQRTVNTTGTVVRVTMRGRDTIVSSPDVEFVDALGNKHEFKSTCGGGAYRGSVGTRIRMHYDPEDPENAEILLTPVAKAVYAISSVAFIGFGFLILARARLHAMPAIFSTIRGD